ncbi:hypothetical protein AB0P07_18875 [Streptomyces sp. NPDC085944]|uniref:hypothetical protein n=1 Tax=Streptomyces sp. NPDC085944 TaxID=3154962 RepID=UPI00343687F2
MGPHTGAPPSGGLSSLNVTGPSPTEADMLATAAYCRSARAGEWLGALPGVAAFAVMPGGQTWTTGNG